MLFHQQVNSVGNRIGNGYLYRGIGWRLHIHKALEFVLVLQGTLAATVGSGSYTVTPGEALLIMPFQPHAYSAGADTVFFVFVFSGDYVPEFARLTAEREPCRALFRPSEPGASYVRQTVGAGIPSDLPEEPITALPTPPELFLAAGLYALCAEFDRTAVWQSKEKHGEVIGRILTYMEENYTKDITLATLADALSYEYHYLSRLFHATLQIPFRTLLHQYRCEMACDRLLTTGDSVTEIAMSCGFRSIRSFNRAFLDFSGVSPSAFRAHGGHPADGMCGRENP